MNVDSLVGIPYKPLGRSMSGIDCIGLISLFHNSDKLKSVFEKKLSPIKYLRYLYKYCDKVISPLRKDIVICYWSNKPEYVGIYLEDGIILQVEEDSGVIKDHMKTSRNIKYNFWRVK